MAFVNFRSQWTRKGVNYDKGDIAQVEDWEVAGLAAQGNAVACDPPPGAAMVDPTDEEVLDEFMDGIGDTEDIGPMFKSGSIPDDAPTKIMRRKPK